MLIQIRMLVNQIRIDGTVVLVKGQVYQAERSDGQFVVEASTNCLLGRGEWELVK